MFNINGIKEVMSEKNINAKEDNCIKEETANINKKTNKFYSLLTATYERREVELKKRKEEKLKKKNEKALKKFLHPFYEELTKQLNQYQKDVCDLVVLNIPMLKYTNEIDGIQQKICVFKIEETNTIVAFKKYYKGSVLIANKYCYLDKNLSFHCITTMQDCMVVAKRFHFGLLVDECQTYLYQTAHKFNLIKPELKNYSNQELIIYNKAKKIITQAETELLNLNYTFFN